MNDTRIVNVRYCERELRKTISVPSSFTIAEAKAAASKELLDHLYSLPGIPPTLTLYDTRVNAYRARQIPDTTIGDPDASGESTECPTPSQSLPQSPPQTSHPNPCPTSDRRDVAMTYCEEGLQITMLVPPSFTMAEVKAGALKGMHEYLRDLLGVLIVMDDAHVDIHPACSTPDLRIGDVCASDKSIIMVVWPKATPGNTTMPSPIMDALRSAAAELACITGWLATLELLVEKSKSKREGSSPTPTPPPANKAQDSAPEDNGGFVWEFLMTQGRISEALRAEDALLATGARILESLEVERAQIWAERAKLLAEKAGLLERVDA